MPYPLPLTRTEAYLAYKAGVIQQSDLKPSLAVPRNGIDAWLAYWTGLAEDYPKREDGTPHILQEEEAYIAYLCGVINEYPEKCLRRVGAYLRYLISARWGRPDHPLNREELYLSLLKTQVIPSGDPSSDIELDGTAKAAFQDLKMYGDTFQQTYSGKNLFNRENYGTLVGWAAQGEIKNYGNRVFYIQCKPETTYTIQKMLARPVERSRCQIFTTADVPAVGGAVIGILFSTNDATQATVTTQSGANYLCVVCYEAVASTETTVQEMADSIMIEEGATASPYEPYVGLRSSPNPDYPQTIQTVTGLQKVNVRGKNLFSMYADILKAVAAGEAVLSVSNGTLDSITDNSLETSATGNDSFITVNGYHGINPNFEYKIPIMPSTEYTLSYSSTGWTQYIIRTFDENNTQLQEFSNNNTGNPTGDYSRTFTTHANAKWLGIRLDNESYRHDETKAKFYNIQLEKSGSPTDYEPYSSRDYEINLGKNLFNATATPWVNKTAYDASGDVASWNGYVGIVEYQPVEPNTTYTFSNSADKPIYYGLVFYDAEKNKISNVTSGTRTFTTPTNCHYVRFAIQNGSIPTWTQIEVGSMATTYAPYMTPVELYKLGEYQDYIWKDGGDLKVHKSTGVVIYDGSNDEDWSEDTSGIYSRKIITIEDSLNVGAVRKADSLSDHFRADTTNDYGIFFRNNKKTYYYPDSDVTTVEEWRTWLSSNNINTIYPLATPTDTTITNQALIDQLEALVAGGAENGTTYIKVSAADPNLPGLLVVEAPKYE